jgi:hypothetical protein
VNAAKLLEELQRRAVVLWIEGEGEHAGVRFKAPPGVLKPPVLAAMKASKRELLALLAAPVAPVEVEPQPQVLAEAPVRLTVATWERRHKGKCSPVSDPAPASHPHHPGWRSCIWRGSVEEALEAARAGGFADAWAEFHGFTWLYLARPDFEPQVLGASAQDGMNE